MADVPLSEHIDSIRGHIIDADVEDIIREVKALECKLHTLDQHRQAMNRYVTELAETLGVDTPEVTLEQLVDYAARNRQWCADKQAEVATLSSRLGEVQSQLGSVLHIAEMDEWAKSLSGGQVIYREAKALLDSLRGVESRGRCGESSPSEHLTLTCNLPAGHDCDHVDGLYCWPRVVEKLRMMK